MAKERLLSVVEYSSFDEAFNAATETKESFSAFQMGTTIAVIKRFASRFFVDENNELWYVTLADARFLHKARIHSCLSNAPFEYVQIMVPSNGIGHLRFSGQYVTREAAIKISADGEVFSFYKA
ncbi:MAG: hypothetical protein PHX80_04405 [Candidatus Nanoarchaeia archaeon]|nr:hypothetical protein [Candidatus Nanoarchaeia archaeon]MDD5551257.1 hypothetical protein [Candidatus Omnitrophota bacterium]